MREATSKTKKDRRRVHVVRIRQHRSARHQGIDLYRALAGDDEYFYEIAATTTSARFRLRDINWMLSNRIGHDRQRTAGRSTRVVTTKDG